MDNIVYSNSYWRDLKLKLIYLKTALSLRDDQGYLNSSIYSGFCNNSVIEKNIFNGSPNSKSLKHDHVVYLKGFDGMKFLENYARGWPSDSSGGIKARNGKNLVIARNYIDDTGILMYTHIIANQGVTIYKGLKNVLVYGNHIVQRTNQGHPKSGIYYSKPHFAGVDENVTYSANVFEIIGGQSPPTEDCIFLTNGNLTEHHVYEDNVYNGTTRKVGIHHRHYTPSYETGNISATLIAPYQNMRLPKYNIPTYTPRNVGK
ncbi:uncharacterized protein LOC114518768 [Dendronephthya gigantea]|uniref:uncharacterized protein LOC114518768 n=1 Tax=Dendronephthya gigantea TaxID=151771 RepID=UPI0010692809|nr:uncharacterized protein LOC114518768 [Dendronephthya gigantea]